MKSFQTKDNSDGICVFLLKMLREDWKSNLNLFSQKQFNLIKSSFVLSLVSVKSWKGCECLVGGMK